LKYD
jgi:hypothetical protein